MMKKLQNKALFLLAFIGLLSVQMNAQVFDFDADAQNWVIDANAVVEGSLYQADGGVAGDGSIRFKRFSNNANIQLSSGTIDAVTNKFLKIRMSNNTPAVDIRVLIPGETNVNYNILTNTGTGYTTFYQDLSGHASWDTAAEALVELYFRKNHPTNNSAAEATFIEIDHISFISAMPASDATSPVFSSGGTATSIVENTGAGQAIYTAVATDNNLQYYALSGTDAADFTIHPGTGVVTLIADPNFEAKDSYSFNVVAYDENVTNGGTPNNTIQAVTLAITNDPSDDSGDSTDPVITSAASATAISENSGASQVVYTITATDDTAVTSYGLEGGDDAASFSITGSTITLTADPDFESKASYTFTVSASDAVGNKGTQLVTLAITDVAESFSYTFDSTNEGFVSNGSRGSAFGSENVWDAGSGSNTGLLVINGLETVVGTSGVSGANNVNAYGPSPVNTGNATHVTVVLRNKTLSTGLKMRAKVNGGSYANVAVFSITANDTEFKTYTFDLSGYANWTGTSTEFSFAAFDAAFDTSTPFDAANINIAFDSIEFTNEAPASTDGTWESGSTWTGGKKPGNGAPKNISGHVTINSDVVSTGPITLTGGSLTVKAGHSLHVSGDLVTNDELILEAGAQIIVSGAVTGNAKYTRTLTADNTSNLTGWYSVSPPVSGEALNVAWADANTLAVSGDTNKRGLASFSESAGSWTYLLANDSNATTFTAGQGYIVKTSSSAPVTFSGGMNTEDVLVPVTIDGDGFNLLGNPYTSLVNSGTFITNNTGNLAQQQIWIWDNSNITYDVAVTADNFMLAPGQAFFVQSNAATNLTFSEDNQATGADTFQKSSVNTNTKLKLTVSNGAIDRYAKLYYLDNATKAYDAGYEGEVFTGLPESFSIYTHLLEDNQGKNYQTQSLPNSDFESMVVPVGLIVGEDSEITFKLEASNVPAGLKVFLEDRQEGIFTQLDVVDSDYKVDISRDSDNIGRFFIHTAVKTVLSVDDIALQGVSVFKSNTSTLKIAGLKNGKVSVSLFNVLGKSVLNSTFQANGVKEISLPKLVAGVYLVQLTTESGKLNKKIILE